VSVAARVEAEMGGAVKGHENIRAGRQREALGRDRAELEIVECEISVAREAKDGNRARGLLAERRVQSKLVHRRAAQLQLERAVAGAVSGDFLTGGSVDDVDPCARAHGTGLTHDGDAREGRGEPHPLPDEDGRQRFDLLFGLARATEHDRKQERGPLPAAGRRARMRTEQAHE
jgi:hypothetical protein